MTLLTSGAKVYNIRQYREVPEHRILGFPCQCGNSQCPMRHLQSYRKTCRKHCFRIKWYWRQTSNKNTTALFQYYVWNCCILLENPATLVLWIFRANMQPRFNSCNKQKSACVFLTHVSKQKQIEDTQPPNMFCKSYTDSLYVLQSKHVACDACKDYSGICVSLSSWFNKGKWFGSTPPSNSPL